MPKELKKKMLSSVYGFNKYLKLDNIYNDSFRALNITDIKENMTISGLDSIVNVIKLKVGKGENNE